MRDRAGNRISCLKWQFKSEANRKSFKHETFIPAKTVWQLHNVKSLQQNSDITWLLFTDHHMHIIVKWPLTWTLIPKLLRSVFTENWSILDFKKKKKNFLKNKQKNYSVSKATKTSSTVTTFFSAFLHLLFHCYGPNSLVSGSSEHYITIKHFRASLYLHNRTITEILVILWFQELQWWWCRPSIIPEIKVMTVE